MRDFRDILAACGPKKELAESLGVPSQTVTSWFMRNSIPGKYFDDIVKYIVNVRHKEITHKIICEVASNSKRHL